MPVLNQRLAGKTAVITGTASGQGRAAALAFASEGAVVVGCDMDDDGAAATVAAVTAAGGRMSSSRVNLTDPELRHRAGGLHGGRQWVHDQRPAGPHRYEGGRGSHD